MLSTCVCVVFNSKCSTIIDKMRYSQVHVQYTIAMAISFDKKYASQKLIPLKNLNLLLSHNGKRKILFQIPEFHLYSAHPEKKNTFKLMIKCCTIFLPRWFWQIADLKNMARVARGIIETQPFFTQNENTSTGSTDHEALSPDQAGQFNSDSN